MFMIKRHIYNEITRFYKETNNALLITGLTSQI